MKINRDSRPPLAVAVVGAGAAGLMAAIFAASRGSRVLLLERTRDGGRKILISGGGRCNILPSTLAPERFVSTAASHIAHLVTRWPEEILRAGGWHNAGSGIRDRQVVSKIQ